jgi:hypothetical protein
MNGTRLKTFIPAAVTALAGLLAACGLVEPEDAPTPEAAMAPALPETLYYGSEYTTILAFKNCASPCKWTVKLSDSLVYGYEGNATAYQPLVLRARRSLDTLRIIASGDGRQDTTLKVLYSRAMGGFAPIESPRTLTWIESETTRSCAVAEGTTRTRYVTFSPLGLLEGAYRFERKIVSSTDSLIQLDTLRLRRAANGTQVGTDTGWATGYLRPFFAQDTLTGELSPDAGRDGPALGYIGASPERATYRQGTGLVEYRLAGGFSVCGATYTRNIKLVE